MVLAILFSLIAFVLSVFFLLAKYKRVTLVICSFFILIGFGLYTTSYLSFGEGFAYTLLAALRGLFSTMRMFIMSHDYGLIASAQGAGWLGNIWLRILFWLAHLSAAIVTQAVILSLFGQKMMESFRLRFGMQKEVYVIKGSDKNALMLGENIATHDMQNPPDTNRLVLFLLDEDSNAEQLFKKSIQFGGITRTLSRKNNLRYYLDKTGFGKWRKRKYHVILMPQDTSAPDDALDIAEYAKEKAATNRLLRKSLDIFVVVSSEFEWVREQIESFTQNKSLEYPCTFNIINETDLLVRQMLKKHPTYTCERLELKTGVAKRQLNVMVLGLGDVGKQALLHLVRNGQFITKNKNLMRAIVVDKEKDLVCGSFWSCYPALKPPLNLVCEIRPESCDVWSEEFIVLLDKYPDIDYIVVALSSNKENKDASRIVRQYYKSRDLPLPVIAVSEKNEGLHRVQQRDFFTFGCREEIYKEAVIIRKDADRMAKAVHEVYGGSPPWHELDWFRQESNRASADFVPAMLKLANLSEEEAMEDGALTQNSILAETLAKTEHLRWNAFHAAMGYEAISIDEMKKRFEAYSGDGNPLDYARRNTKNRLQVCLVPWDALDEVSKAYRELAHHAGDEKEQTRDFKDNDRSIVQYIPKFLKAAKGRE